MKNNFYIFTLLLALLCSAHSWGEQLNEGFEGATFPPTDWNSIHVSGTSNWTRAGSDGYVSPRGSKYAKVAYANSGHNNYLITPQL